MVEKNKQSEIDTKVVSLVIRDRETIGSFKGVCDSGLKESYLEGVRDWEKKSEKGWKTIYVQGFNKEDELIYLSCTRGKDYSELIDEFKSEIKRYWSKDARPDIKIIIDDLGNVETGEE